MQHYSSLFILCCLGISITAEVNHSISKAPRQNSPIVVSVPNNDDIVINALDIINTLDVDGKATFNNTVKSTCEIDANKIAAHKIVVKKIKSDDIDTHHIHVSGNEEICQDLYVDGLIVASAIDVLDTASISNLVVIGSTTIEGDQTIDGDLSATGNISADGSVSACDVIVGCNVLLNTTSSNAIGSVVQNGNSLMHTFGLRNLFLGIDAGTYAVTNTGTDNTAIGFNSQNTIFSGARNTALGANTLLNNLYGSNNVAIGTSALRELTGGFPLPNRDNNNIAIGAGALVNLKGLVITDATSNVSIGTGSMQNNTVGSFNVVVGDSALQNPTSGDFNIALGYGAMQLASGGDSNIAIGFNALQNNNTGGNVGIGTSSMFFNTTGSSNVAVGGSSLQNNTTGGDNTAIGLLAINSNTTGNFNTGVGRGALGSNVSSSFNTAVGAQSLVFGNTGTENSALGFAALANNTGSFNIAIGSRAGRDLTTGSNNIHIGNTGSAGEGDTIRIGVQGTQSATYIAGIRGITTGINNAVAVLIDSNGQMGTISSSERFKSNIRDIGTRSELLMKLRPVIFNYKGDEESATQFGLIAEEVAQVCPELVAYDENNEPYSVKYHLLDALLINELQNQFVAISNQQAEIAQLRGLINNLLIRVIALEG